MGVRKRPTKASYIDIGKGAPSFVLMGTGFTELNESPSAQNASKRYVNQLSATKSITSYDWSTPFSADQIPEYEAIDFICSIGENMKTGADAEADYVMVDLDKPVSGSPNTFKARKIRVAIAVSEFPDNDGEMGVSGDLLGVGDIAPGTFNTETRAYTDGEVVEVIGKLIVTSAAGTTSGDTKITVTPALTGGNSYKHKVAANPVEPTYNQSCTTGYTAWDGTADITAASGQKIVVVEVDSGNLAKKTGTATVAAKV